MSIRGDFPILSRQVGDNALVYLDNAATTQKPLAVLEAVETYYKKHNANVHRAAHKLAGEATAALEGARESVATYLKARDPKEIIFTRGTTEAINLVANILTPLVGKDDEIHTRQPDLGSLDDVTNLLGVFHDFFCGVKARHGILKNTDTNGVLVQKVEDCRFM